MQALQQTDVWDPTFFHHVRVRLFTIFYETSFQNCCNVCICRIGFIYGSCMMVFRHIFF